MGYAEQVDYSDDSLPQIRQLGHELRNALTSVLTAAEILKRRCGAAAESEYEVITRQVYRMRKLVDEMLSLTGRQANGTNGADDPTVTNVPNATTDGA